MRLFIAGMVTETNTFSPMPTTLADFEAYGLYDGDVTSRAPDAMHGIVPFTWRNLAEADGHQVVEGLAAFAQPAGRVVERDYEDLRDRILHRLKAALPLDVVLLNLHGAMASEACDDCEGDLLARVREIVGDRVVIGVELDLHCHLTDAMLAGTNLVIAYKHYPHDDMVDRARELYALAIRTAAGSIRPVTRVFDCRMVGLWPTTADPMRGMVGDLKAAEQEPGILSVSLGHGFPWGDVAEVGARSWVVSNGDERLATAVAERLGRRFLAMREKIGASTLSIDDAIDRALAAAAGPVVLADVADNPGGGAPGNSSFILHRLIERGIGDVATGCYWEPEAAAGCARAGVGAEVELCIGGRFGAVSGEPVRLTGRVRAVAQDHSQSALSGSRLPLGLSAWVETKGVDIVVCSIRNQTFAPDAFTGLGVPLIERRIVVVKSIEHFRAAFAPIATDIVHVTTPGAIRPDFAAIPYTKRDGRFWPRVRDPFAGAPEEHFETVGELRR